MEEKNSFKPTRVDIKKGKIQYILSKSDSLDLNKLTDEEIFEYINTNYIDKNDVGGLVNDIRIFKTYKDDLEIQIKSTDIFVGLLNSFILVISIFLATNFGLESIQNNLNKIVGSVDKKEIIIFYTTILGEVKYAGYILIGILILETIIFVYRNLTFPNAIKKLRKNNFLTWLVKLIPNSKSKSLKAVGYAIHTLESIKEENYHNQDYSEEKKDDNQEIKPDEQETETLDQKTVVSDSNASETKMSSASINWNDLTKNDSISHNLTIARDEGKTTLSIQNRHYQLSYSSETVSSGTQTDDLITYVTKNYFNRDHFDRGKLINDLILFKTIKFDIEMDIKRDGNFFTKKQLSNILLSERNDRWSRNNRLKTVNNIILVLEAIKEEIDTKKKD